MTLEAAAFPAPRRVPRALGTVAYWGVVGALVVLALALAAAAAPIALGLRPVVVHGGSMGGTIPGGSMAMTHWVDADELQVGDVILVRAGGDRSTSAPNIHRIVSLQQDGDSILVETKGDANDVNDPGLYILPDRVLAYSYHIPLLGLLLGYLTTPGGWVVLIALPAVVLCLLTLRSIWKPDRRPANASLRAQ